MSQAPIRLIAIDVDSTLLNSRHRVEAAVTVSLKEQHERGIKIVLATAVVLAERFGLDVSATAAIGDGLNDIEMIKASAFGIAMGNAGEEVKSAADWITSSHDEGGVAEAIQELLRRRLI